MQRITGRHDTHEQPVRFQRPADLHQSTRRVVCFVQRKKRQGKVELAEIFGQLFLTGGYPIAMMRGRGNKLHVLVARVFEKGCIKESLMSRRHGGAFELPVDEGKPLGHFLRDMAQQKVRAILRLRYRTLAKSCDGGFVEYTLHCDDPCVWLS